MVSFVILPLPGFTFSALTLFLDPIRLAADEKDHSRQVRCSWKIVTLTGDPVASSCGMSIHPTDPLGALDHADYVVVVGGVRSKAWLGRSSIRALLKRCDERRQHVVGLCTGAFALAEAGLLDGDLCSVSWFHRSDFEEHFDRVAADTTHHFNSSGRHFTSAGGLGAAYLSLSIIRAEFSEDVARKAASMLLIPFERIGATQPALSVNGVTNPVLRRAILMMEDTLEAPMSMTEVARALEVSSRQLQRRFRQKMGRTAGEVRNELRVLKAKELLAQTDLALIDVAVACGFSGTGSLNRAFSRYGEKPPREVRAADVIG